VSSDTGGIVCAFSTRVSCSVGRPVGRGDESGVGLGVDNGVGITVGRSVGCGV